MLHYEEVSDSYLLKDEEGNISYKVDKNKMSFLLTYTPDVGINWTMHKHGSLEDVLPHYQRYLEAYNTQCLFGKPYIITGAFPVEEINRLISTTGYGKYFLPKLGISMIDLERGTKADEPLVRKS